MKIIHCSDLHLDSKMERKLSLTKSSERRNELLNNFQRLIVFAKENDVKAILISGDLFDSNSSRVSTKNVLKSEISANSEITFFYVCGNHDDNFNIFEEDCPDNFIVFDDKLSSFKIGDINISGLNLTKDNINNFYDELNFSENFKNIFMLHGDVFSNAQPNLYIDLKKLKDKNIDYLALGHIHMSSMDKIDDRGVYCYPGCLEGRGFDECGEKGFMLLEVENTISYEFIKFAQREFVKKEMDITNLFTIEDYKLNLENIFKNLKEKDFVRLIFIGTKDEDCNGFANILENLYKDKFYYFEIVDNSSVKFNISKYMEEETSLKAEFLKLVFQDENLSEEDKNKIANVGLQALKGDDIIL